MLKQSALSSQSCSFVLHSSLSEQAQKITMIVPNIPNDVVFLDHKQSVYAIKTTQRFTLQTYRPTGLYIVRVTFLDIRGKGPTVPQCTCFGEIKAVLNLSKNNFLLYFYII